MSTKELIGEIKNADGATQSTLVNGVRFGEFISQVQKNCEKDNLIMAIGLAKKSQPHYEANGSQEKRADKYRPALLSGNNKKQTH